MGQKIYFQFFRHLGIIVLFLLMLISFNIILRIDEAVAQGDPEDHPHHETLQGAQTAPPDYEGIPHGFMPEESVAPSFCSGFEEGELEQYMSIFTTSSGDANGRVEVATNFPFSGVYGLNLDTDCYGCGGNTTQAMIMSVDLAGQQDVQVSFWAMEHEDESNYEDGVFVSNNDGNTYEKIYDFADLPATQYSRIVLNLDEAVASAGLTYTDGFLIKFQGYDNYSIPSDGYSLDDICVCVLPNSPIQTSISEVGDRDVQLDWNDTPEGVYEVWYANNDPEFIPGDDCDNPAPYRCDVVYESSFYGTNLRGHPDYNYTFVVLGRNACGQRTDLSLTGHTSVMNFAIDETGIPANLAVSIINPHDDIVFSSAEIPVDYTVSYTNTSSYSANHVVITQTLPAHTLFNAIRSTSGWSQVAGTDTYTMSIGMLPSRGDGTVYFAVDVDSSLPRSISSTVAIGDTQSPAPDPDASDDADSVENALIGTPDNDGDGLPDWAETGTGVFLSAANAGTYADNADSDGDAIIDGDEARGTVDGLDLPAMGASPVHKNILLEYDWFEDNAEPETCGPHSHRPTDSAIAALSDAFSNAPLENPDGVMGITLINDYGQGGVFTGGNYVPDDDGVIAGGVNDSDFQTIKRNNFAQNRLGYFHYVLLPHRYNTDSSSSGQAEWPGNDLIVSLYCYGTDKNVSHTIMHELGHNLGLGHGGDNACNYKPNYNSVMNYRYQFPGVDNNCDPEGDDVLDYSRGQRLTLDENDLDENDGTCGTVAWDWNADGSIENSVLEDVNSDDAYEESNCGGFYTILHDWNDWASLDYGAIVDGDGAKLETIQLVIEQPLPQNAATK